MTDAAAAIVSAVIAAVVALATALVTARSQVKELETRFEHEQQADQEKKRLHYLDPLVVSACWTSIGTFT